MSNLKTFLLTLFISSLLISKTYAQNKDVKKADEIFNYCHYYDAIDFYKNALDKETDKKENPKSCLRLQNATS